LGLTFAAQLQTLFTAFVFFGLLLVAMSVFWIDTPASITPPAFSSTPPLGLLGLAMVFVLLTFGGWNESAYISAELKGGSRAMVGVIVVSLALITLLYLLINMALLKGLGLPALAASQTAASELAQRGLGPWADRLIATLVALAALTSINATMIVGARSNYALGRDWQGLKTLGQWEPTRSTPISAYVVQSVIAVALIGLGSLYVDGFEAMVEFTAPVFWGFLCLVGLALMRLRRIDPDTPRPFKVPFYPALPIVFCLTCAYLTYSSVMYAQSQGAIHVSIMVMAAGVVALWLLIVRQKRADKLGL
jgi:amino acid transporter